MNTKTLLMVALSGLAANTASAGTNIWTSGWAMGTAEYAVDDGNGNELVIACPSDEDRYVSASATVSGRGYSSEDGRGFDLIVDGKTFHTRFTQTVVPAAASSLMSSGGPCATPIGCSSALKAKSSTYPLRTLRRHCQL